MAPDLLIPLAQVPRSAAIARAGLAACLARHDFDECSKAAVLVVVSELVTNAVVHGMAPISLSASLGDSVVHIEVSDATPPAARLSAGDALGLSSSGRGLAIVEALSDRWGEQANREGKTVWAEIAVASP